MSEYIPTFTITINDIDYTGDVLSGATITSGRADMFSQILPSSAYIELVNLGGSSPVINLLDVIVIKTTDSTDTDVPLFTGEITAVSNSLDASGSGGFANTLQIQANGYIGKLVKRYAGNDAYPQEFDGQRIQRILEEALYLHWSDLPNTLTWSEIDPAQTWADYGVQGLDQIDTGRYEVLARAAEVAQAYELADITEISGLGYLYETGSGLIGYADAERRTKTYGTNLISLDASHLSSQGLVTRLQTTDIANSVTIQYGDPTAEIVAINNQSIEDFGRLEQINSTILAEVADATEQATRFVALRGNPVISLETINLNLANPNIDDITRDALIGISMDSLIYLTNLPAGIIATQEFEGFVESWTFTIAQNSLDLQIQVSNSIFSAFEVQWEDYNATTQWQNLPNTLTWLDLAIG